MPKLIMLCGFPGVGKSTFAREHLTDKGVYISRDEIRMRYLKPGDDYFAYERRVWTDFVELIVENLAAGRDVVSDATNMTRKSRRKLLNDIRLWLDGSFEIQCYYFNVPVEVAVERNNKREGRAKVPESALRKMAATFIPPEYDEDDAISFIFEVNQDGKIRVR